MPDRIEQHDPYDGKLEIIYNNKNVIQTNLNVIEPIRYEESNTAIDTENARTFDEAAVSYLKYTDPDLTRDTEEARLFNEAVVSYLLYTNPELLLAIADAVKAIREKE